MNPASENRGEPILRVVPQPADINSTGHIFGGWVLSQMDIAGGIVAGRIADGACATVAIETMQFIAPILVRDLVSIYATVERRGREEAWCSWGDLPLRGRGGTDTFVASGSPSTGESAFISPEPVPQMDRASVAGGSSCCRYVTPSAAFPVTGSITSIS